MPTAAAVILTTVPNEQSALTLAHTLVERSLAACVQHHPIRSVYRWENEVCNEPEHLLLIKTQAARYPEVEALILESHPYALPEIVLIPIDRASPAYLAWIASSTA